MASSLDCEGLAYSTILYKYSSLVFTGLEIDPRALCLCGEKFITELYPCLLLVDPRQVLHPTAAATVGKHFFHLSSNNFIGKEIRIHLHSM